MQDIVQMITEMILLGYVGLFIICFLINMIPFLSPSNMVLAGAAALLLSGTIHWVAIGVIVAIAATLAKLIHYYVVRGSRAVMSDERIKSLEDERARVEKWGGLALFIAAASPVPDDPLIVYVGLTKYNVFKFLVYYFTGKVAVTLAGALLGYAIGGFFESIPIIVASIALTALITGFLFKRKTEGEESDMLQDILEESMDTDEPNDTIGTSDDDMDKSESVHKP